MRLKQSGPFRWYGRSTNPRTSAHGRGTYGAVLLSFNVLMSGAVERMGNVGKFNTGNILACRSLQETIWFIQKVAPFEHVRPTKAFKVNNSHLIFDA
jgi:hypothetical protein